MLKKILILVVVALLMGSVFGGMPVMAQDSAEDVVEIVIPKTYFLLLNVSSEAMASVFSEEEGHISIEELEDGSVVWTVTKELQDGLVELMTSVIESIPELVEFDWLSAVELSENTVFDVYIDPKIEAINLIDENEFKDLLYFIMSYGYSLWIYEGIGNEDVSFQVNFLNSETTELLDRFEYQLSDLLPSDEIGEISASKEYAEITYAGKDLERMGLSKEALIAQFDSMEGHLSYEINAQGDVVQRVSVDAQTELISSTLRDLLASLESDERLSAFVDFNLSNDLYEYFLVVDPVAFDAAQEEIFIEMFLDTAEDCWMYFNETYEEHVIALYVVDAESGDLIKGMLLPQNEMAETGEVVEIFMPNDILVTLGYTLMDMSSLMLKEGYVSVTVNNDGDITTVVEKEYYDQEIEEVHDRMAQIASNSAVNGLESIVMIEENEDFSEINVYVDAATFDEGAEELVTAQIGGTVGTYWVLTGQFDSDGFVLHFLDNDTGEVIKTVEY